MNDVIVKLKDGRVVADSRDVAETFGKRHDNVIRDIRNLECSNDFKALNFEAFKIKDLSRTEGESTSHYEMTRDGFSFLVMGFNGKEAAVWKEKYIAAFNRMEAERMAWFARDPREALNDPVMMRLLLADYSEKVITLEAEKKVLKVDADVAVRIANASHGSMCLTDAAKTLGFKRVQDFIRELNSRDWIYKRAHTDHWVAYQDRIKSGDLEHKVTVVRREDGSEKVTQQVRVTPAGIARLAKLFPQDSPGQEKLL